MTVMDGMPNAAQAAQDGFAAGTHRCAAARRMKVVRIKPDDVPLFATQRFFERRYRCVDRNIE
jgi:hypothetical protein